MRPLRITHFAWSIAAIAVALSALFVPPSIAQSRQAVYNLDIPAQSLNDSLQALALVSQHKLLYSSELVDGRQAPALKGEFTAGQAVRQLLAGTGLECEVSDGLILIRTKTHPLPGPQGGTSQKKPLLSEVSAQGLNADRRDAESSTAIGGTVSSGAAGINNEGSSGRLEEIVVTAQKKSERLQDVPVPVTAIRADALTGQNRIRLQDYASLVPGLSATTDDYGAPQVAIRGLTMGGLTQGKPTTGIVVDDVPYDSSPYAEAPDLDPTDLARIEVLRGPQGTLYGASSLGGLIKYVTIDPSPAEVNGHFEAGLSDVKNGTGLGYTVRGAINLPLGESSAVRASAFSRKNPGFIDDPTLGTRGVNKGEVYGGRFAGLWRLPDDFSVRLSAYYQHTSIDGSPYVDMIPGLSGLQQSRVRNTGWYEQSVKALNLTLKGRLWGVDVTSVSGYTENNVTNSLDFTYALGFLTQDVFGVPGTPLTGHFNTSRFTQEIRFADSIGERFEWLAGLFYDHQSSPGGEDMYGSVPSTGEVIGLWLHHYGTTTTSEYAAFGDLTVHVTNRFDIQFGARGSEHKTRVAPHTYEGIYDPIFLGLPSPVIYPRLDSTDSSFTYLVTPRIRVSDDLMLYARLASGYRPGAPNANLFAENSGVPKSYKPDTTESYEIGVKGSSFGQMLTYDVSVFYIDWKDIQLQLTDPQTSFIYTDNASGGKSQGLELALEARPLPWLTLSGWIAWNEAELSADFPPTSIAYGVSGNPLPYSSRWSGSLSADLEFPLNSRAKVFGGLTAGYVGKRFGQFTATPDRQLFSGYTRTDLRAGVRSGPWEINAFVNNLTDKRALLNGGLGTYTPIAFGFIQPRTIGVSVGRSF